MITISYLYFNKTENKMKEAERIFYDVHKAIRFCWSMKNRRMALIGWSCLEPEDNEFMLMKVNFTKINGYRC